MTFVKGESGNPTGKRKDGSDVTVQPTKAVPPKMLTDMRYVLDHAKEKDESKARKEYRSWLAEDRAAFLSKMNALEIAYQRTKAGKNETTPSTVSQDKPGARGDDPGTDRCLELIEKLLSEWEAQK